ncbi:MULTISPECIES: CbrC family protein [Lysinibacillus]|uniref:CbrC family protein n=1 Tax=Lysinibacillus capsici TaxID=2115968 RepID=A0A2X1BRF1_9BACI|nr:CbrC family protein [Lysinibacillus capsici]MCT1541475.1 CbrC family protein [Lysinibacillus capsici]MCT1572801.1 CbrC family protein [Lysinibacillus capsici]MCT1649965.1 CbrC family protein [Lysinibacillus capsici]MCT1727264.1 CbrC family protein [Lysinibacillus capsici]MCT1786127.1 CbrC family protein [Lysinibacillus capsici]
MTIVEEWHELRQKFNPSNPITINQMHIFKDQLKQVQQTEETLRILVEVYCLLRMYPEAYQLFTVIMNKDDKKDRKKYGVLQTYIDKPNSVNPLLPRKIRDHQQLKTKIPTFKYLPNPLEAEIFETDEIVVCDCCEQEVDVYYTGGIYAIEEVDYLCPSCIHSGEAAQKYDGSFQQDLMDDEQVTNPKFAEEVLFRTPGYVSWQGNNWVAHCSDYCAFIGYVGWRDLVELGIEDQFDNYTGFSKEELSASLMNNGHHQGYLFQCLECDRYVLYSDFS